MLTNRKIYSIISSEVKKKQSFWRYKAMKTMILKVTFEKFEKFENRMQVAKLMAKQYEVFHGVISVAIDTIRSYESTGDFVVEDNCAYCLHQF